MTGNRLRSFAAVFLTYFVVGLGAAIGAIRALVLLWDEATR